MSKITRVGVLAFAGLLLGCGENYDTSRKGPAPPHGGTLIALPDGKSVVEVVFKPAAAKATETSGEVAFYVLKPDSTPFMPAPTTGTFMGNKKKVTLVADGGGLVTPKGPPMFPNENVEGTLTFDLGGETHNVPIGVR